MTNRSGLTALLCMAVVVAGCGSTLRQHLITGEPFIYGVDYETGALVDRDVAPAPPTSEPEAHPATGAAAGGNGAPAGEGGEEIQQRPVALGVVPHRGEIVTIYVDNVFIRYLKELASPHVLVYAQVFDDGTDNPETALTKVLFNKRHQPSGQNLGLADRILYGPAAYKGYPIRIRFLIVELDKEDKKLASDIINAVGDVAGTAQPAAGPAINVAVQIAQAINALNEDDIELEFDLTLSPVGPVGVARIEDAVLTPLKEPVQREGKPLTLVSSLRTGPYAVIKRELPERFPLSGDCDIPSVLHVDWTQEAIGFTYNVAPGEDVKTCNGDSAEGNAIVTNELIRHQGGYLYRVISDIADAKGHRISPCPDQDSASAVPVQLRCGPEKDVGYTLVPGLRRIFKLQTYVTLNVVNGMPRGLDEGTLRASSDREVRDLQGLLDNPQNLPTSERLAARVDALASAVKTQLEQRRIGEAAARRAGRDPEFRTSTNYPLFWVKQVDALTAAPGTAERTNAEARNAAVVEVLSDLVVNLPLLASDAPAQMGALRGLSADDFEAVAGKPGLFQLTANALTTLLASM